MPKIAFLLPNCEISGGINVVFHQAAGLVERGMTVAIVTPAPVTRRDIEWHKIASMFGHPSLLWLDHHDIAHHRFDLAIATWWQSFFDLWKVQADKYAYFVQSIESRFYPREERLVRAAVDATYDAAIGYLTEACWIRDYLRRVHGRHAELVPNGIDKAIFCPDGEVAAPRRAEGLRVLVEGYVEAAFKNVPAAVRVAREAGAQEVWLLTTSALGQLEGVDRIFSRIPQAQTAAVYRACDVLVKLSTVEGMFGPPLEMFHCGGTAVVYNVTGHDEYIVHGKNALIAPMGDEATVRRYLEFLRATPELLAQLKAGALATAAAWPDWRQCSEQFANAIHALMSQPTLDRAALGAYSRRIWQMTDRHLAHSTELQRRLAEQHAHMLQRETELGSRLTEQHEQLVEHDRRLAEQAMELHRLRHDIHTLTTSTSWRITGPVRAAAQMLGNAGDARRAFGFLRRGKDSAG